MSRSLRCVLLVLAGLLGAAAARPERVVTVTARRFAFSPSTIELALDRPVILELRAVDRKHGFSVPELGIDAVLVPGKLTRLRLVPDRPGTFAFHCSVFCGSGHEDMTGEIVVTP